ncbi:MAG: NAD kinase [Bacteroidota bacterium]
MKIAVYGRSFDEKFLEVALKLFNKLIKEDVSVFIYEPFFDFLNSEMHFEPEYESLFTNHKQIDEKFDFVLSIGGDGTFLETVSFVREKNIPIIGINTGKLGFLANISKEEISKAMDSVFKNDYEIEERSLIHLTNENEIFGGFPYALNDLTVHKNDSSAMMTIHAYINDEYLNSYWADGLIIATPTGSTAYSLSAGGPIVVPDSKSFIITPLAPHNLTVRPIVVSDNREIVLKIDGRSLSYLTSLDYRSEVFDRSIVLKLKKADFSIKTVKLKHQNYFATLRNKLSWGVDKRN